ncbi:MAG: response regulator transcription factor, partial [Steroidobacteraceae bacterium]
MTSVTVLLVDDHAVVREGYRLLLERAGDIHVVGEAATAAEAVERYAALSPQVVVMDIALPGASGIEALREVRSRDADARVLMFSMYEETIYAERALKAGAQGYVTKASAPATLVEAVRTVASGKPYLTPSVAQALALKSLAAETSSASALSAREF